MNETEQQNAAQPATPATTLPLPHYRSHKLVQAALITGMLGPGPLQGGDGARLLLRLPSCDGHVTVEQAVSAEYMRKHDPREGGYFVRYADGYESFSPAEAFEQGYKPLQLLPTAEWRRAEQGRRITSHHVNDANKKLRIVALDGPGPGGASHLYDISGFSTASNPSDPFTERYGQPAEHSTVLFQNGPIKEAGVNGVTHEALLAILIDRLDAFQAGPFACDENAAAVADLRAAAAVLASRTRRRMTAGTEGTHQGE